MDTVNKLMMLTPELCGSFADLSNIVGTSNQPLRSKIGRRRRQRRRRNLQKRMARYYDSEQSCPEESPECSSSAESEMKRSNVSGRSTALNHRLDIDVHSNGHRRRIASRKVRRLDRQFRNFKRPRFGCEANKKYASRGAKRYSFCNVGKFFQPWLWKRDKYGSPLSDVESNFSDMSPRNTTMMIVVFIGVLLLILYILKSWNSSSAAIFETMNSDSTISDKIENENALSSSEIAKSEDAGTEDSTETFKDLEKYLKYKAWKIITD